MAINRDKVYDGAMKLLTSGKFDKAIAEFQKLLVDDPKDVRTLLKVAETLHVKMGNRKDALVHYDRAATLYTEQGFFLKAVAVFKQMLTVDATNPELHLRLAELYQQLGYGSQCLLHYQQVVVLYEQQEQPKDKVLDILKRMVDLDPENLASRIKVAELFAQAGKVQEAAAEMRAAYDYLKAQQRVDDALRVGERILAFDGNALDVARDLANLYMARQDAKQALAKLQLCFKVDPRNIDVLGAIAEAFRALDQVPKTISVYKEIARIHEGNNDKPAARTFWEKVLELAPGDDDAEVALGRRAAPVAAAPVAAAQPARPSAEDEQLQRLLTETDVYVKYGLRDKAIEHLDKIFAIRPDHLPGLEKLKTLQTQTKQPTADTLRRLIAKGSEVNHPKVAEWKAELAKSQSAPAPKPAPPPPAPKPPPSVPSTEGEVILVEEDAAPPPPPKAAPPPPKPEAKPAAASTMAAPPPSSLTSTKKPPPTIRGAQPRQIDDNFDAPTMAAPLASLSQPSASALTAPLPLDTPLQATASLPSAPSMPFDEPLARFEAPRDEPLDEPLEDPLDEPLAPVGRNVQAAPPALPPDESLEGSLDESFDETTSSPKRELVLDEALDAGSPDGGFGGFDAGLDAVADTDALVRAALKDAPAARTLPELPADEAFGDDVAQAAPVAPAAPFAAPAAPMAAPSPLSAPLGADFDDTDALAAAALRESENELVLSDDDVGELAEFVKAASQEGAAVVEAEAPPPFDVPAVPAPVAAVAAPVAAPVAAVAAPVAALPPEFSFDDDGGFSDERTVAYGAQSMAAMIPKANEPPKPSPTAMAFDEAASNLPAEAFAPPAVSPTTAASLSSAMTMAEPQLDRALANEAPERDDNRDDNRDDKFDPNEFDLPDDVKAMLGPPPEPKPARPSPFPEMLDDAPPALGDDELPAMPTGAFDMTGFQGGATLLPEHAEFAASVPSLASVDADAVVEVEEAPPPVAEVRRDGLEPGAPVADADDADVGQPSQSRNLFAPARGFEDDPANTFFPDELAEAEFFIQQDLLDEAREILEPILEEVEDSLRVQHMLARVAAKEAGEPEPPAPWEQKLIDDVAAQLDDLAASQPPTAAHAPQQVSVEEVLSQFKKGVAETVPEDDAATHYDLGIAYREMGLLDDAVSEFQISARAQSKAADSWYLVGLVRLDQGRADDALAALERAFFSAAATEAQKAAADYQRGIIFEDVKKEGAEALACFKRAKDLGGNAPDLERRIAALTKVYGDVPARGDKSAGRPKNIDYL